MARTATGVLVALALVGLTPVDRALAAVSGPAAKCVMCHELHSDANRVGPTLKGVYGRKAGAVPGFAFMFTRYIKGEPWVWDEAHLRAWMDDARKAIHEFTGDAHARTRMPALHVRGAEADAIIKLLKTLK